MVVDNEPKDNIRDEESIDLDETVDWEAEFDEDQDELTGIGTSPSNKSLSCVRIFRCVNGMTHLICVSVIRTQGYSSVHNTARRGFKF